MMNKTIGALEQIKVVAPRVLRLVIALHAYAKGYMAHAKSFQSRPTLCNPMDCSLPGFSVHGILQARILEWVAISYSRGSIEPLSLMYPALQVGSLPLVLPGGLVIILFVTTKESQ